MINRNDTLKRICVSAVLISIGTVLSLFKFEGLWLYGGGVTFCSMLPLVIASAKYGTKWGVFTAFCYSLLQIVLGIDNVQYASSLIMALEIIMLDYVLAYTSIGLSSVFAGKTKSRIGGIVLGIVMTFSLRLLCHFISGWIIWDALWPNELGMISPVYSISYNSSYMIPEAAITIAVSLLINRIRPQIFQEEQ